MLLYLKKAINTDLNIIVMHYQTSLSVPCLIIIKNLELTIFKKKKKTSQSFFTFQKTPSQFFILIWQLNPKPGPSRQVIACCLSFSDIKHI